MNALITVTELLAVFATHNCEFGEEEGRGVI